MAESSAELDQPHRDYLVVVRWWAQVTALMLVIVELTWVLPWYRTVMQISYVASPLRAALVLGAVMVIAYASAYALENWRILRHIQLAFLAALFLGCLVVGSQILLNARAVKAVSGLIQLNPGAVLVVFAMLWMWWRGVTLAREPVRPIIAYRRFELGLLMFLIYTFIVVRMDDGTGSNFPGLGLFVFYLFAGLMSVVFARISYSSLAHGVTKNPFDRRWLVTTIGILAIAIGFAALLGSLLTGQYLLLLDWLAELVRLFFAVVIFIAALPGLLLSNLLGPLVPLLRKAIATPSAPSTLAPGELPPIAPNTPPQPLSPSTQTLIFWGIILLVLLIVFLRTRRRSSASRRYKLEEPESLLEKGDARRLLRKMLQDAAGNLAERLRPVRRRLAAARIRRIYLQLIDLNAELNNPRPESVTPLEFISVMGELFPAQTEELELITLAYNKVRYGELPETESEVSLVEDAWQRVEQQGDLLRKAGRHKLKTAEVKEIQRGGM